MAQQKMHCDVQRTHSNSQKVSDVGKGSLLRKSLEQNTMRPSFKDGAVSSPVWRNSDHRCAILTFLTFEPDGRLKIVALPLQCANHSNQLGSRAQVNMDGHPLVSRPPISSFKVDRQKTQRGTPDSTFSVNSFVARSLSGSNVQRHSRNKALANKATKSTEDSGNSSCQDLVACSDFSGLVPSGSDVTSSSNMDTDKPKVVKGVKKNSRKKGRRKGKRNKKLSCNTSSTELEVFSEKCANGSSTSENPANNDMDHWDGPVSYATASVVSSPACGVNRNDFEGDGNCAVNSSTMLKACTSYIDELDVSEAILTSVDAKFTGEHPAVDSENGVQTNAPVSISNGGVEDTHRKQSSCCDDMCSNALSDVHDSLVLGSVSVTWKSDDSTGAGSDARKERNGIDLLEPPRYNVREGFFSDLNSLNSFVESYNHAEGTKCGSQGCSGNEMQLVISGKRGKQGETLPGNSSVYRLGSVGDSHGHTGKENNYSVWQKVQKNDADKCNCESEIVNPVCSQFDITLKEAPLLKRNCNVVESDTLSKAEDQKHLKFDVSRKLKRQNNSGLKQEYNYYSRKGTHAMKASSDECTKINMQQNEWLDIPAQVNDKKELVSVPRSHSQMGSQRVGFCTASVESVTSEPVQGLQVCPAELEPFESACNSASHMNDQTTENWNSLFSKPCDSLGQSNLLEVQPPVYLPHLIGKEITEVEKEVSVVENGKQGHSSGSVLQKWIPVGIKDSGLTSSCRADSSSLAHSNEPAPKGWISESIVQVKSGSNSHNLVPSTNVGVLCMGQSSGNEYCSSPEDERRIQKLRDQNMGPHKDRNPAANFSSSEMEDRIISAFETDSRKISQAVNDACMVRVTSEAVQVATGSPIAEFERLLHSASPVICQSDNVLSCQICSRDQIIGASLCRHETPNISLGRLWQWYEKHGSYGLEVRPENYEKSKRLGVDCFAFRAYFVPYLSAVQLFRSRKCSSVENSERAPIHELSEACEMDEKSEKSSNVGCLPIFSILVPQRHPSNTSLLPLVSQACSSEPSSISAKDDVSVQSADTTGSDDLELLFEYFESEQPLQRRPLFEKIKELVRGGPSQCKAYGDPATLASINLHDLHPRSWYSVAWYPIYRIPDGNFRGAFLTYHSLGCFAHRSATFDSPRVDACIVSPVVGLQSYNAQFEGWFQPKHTAVSQTTETQGLNPSEILKERMRTLEETASLMARAAISKGNQTSVNRHPDFEFFLTRRR